MSGSITTAVIIPPPSLTCDGAAVPGMMLPVRMSGDGPWQTTSLTGNVNDAPMATLLCPGTTTNTLYTAYQSWWYQGIVFNVSATTQPTGLSWLCFNTSTASGHMFTPPSTFTRPRRILSAALRAGRRAVRRQIDVYARFRGAEEIRRFIAGDVITIEGQFYDYRIRRTRDVLHHTMNPTRAPVHTPFDLRLVDKTTKLSMASGCVYIPDTPVIDQLLALALHARARDSELDMLGRTNWSPTPRPLAALLRAHREGQLLEAA